MKKKQKHKSNRLLDTLFVRPFAWQAPLPLDIVMERLRTMAGDHQQWYFFTSRLNVEGEMRTDEYRLDIQVNDNHGNSVFAYFTGVAYMVDNEATRVEGKVGLNTHMLGIALSLVAMVFVIAWLVNDTPLRLFVLVILLGSPVYMLANLLIKRQLLINQMTDALTSPAYDSAKSKSKPNPTR